MLCVTRVCGQPLSFGWLHVQATLCFFMFLDQIESAMQNPSHRNSPGSVQTLKQVCSTPLHVYRGAACHSWISEADQSAGLLTGIRCLWH
jgi:hypothetical protein